MRGEVESDHGAFLLQAGHGHLGEIARVQNLIAYKSDQRHSCVVLINGFSIVFTLLRTVLTVGNLCRAGSLHAFGTHG